MVENRRSKRALPVEVKTPSNFCSSRARQVFVTGETSFRNESFKRDLLGGRIFMRNAFVRDKSPEGKGTIFWEEGRFFGESI